MFGGARVQATRIYNFSFGSIKIIKDITQFTISRREFSDKPFYRDKRDLLMTKVFVHVSTVFCPHITLQSLDMTSFVKSQSFQNI